MAYEAEIMPPEAAAETNEPQRPADGKEYRRRQEIVGRLIREKQRWNDMSLLEVRFEGAEINDTVKVEADPEELSVGECYRFFGVWRTHDKYGEQFHATSFVKALPVARDAVIEYLSRQGVGLGIGLGRARRLWDVYGSDCLDTLRQKPAETARAVPGWTLPQALELAEILRRDERTEACTIEMHALIAGLGVPKSIIRAAIQAFGTAAAERIRRNPYLLMQFPGCGFVAADKLYVRLGHDPQRLKRQAYAAVHSIASNTDGHVWFPAGMAHFAVGQHLGSAAARPEEAVRLAVRGKLLAERNGPAGELLADGKTARNEERLALRVARGLASRRSSWPYPEELEGVSDHQRREAGKALAGRIGVLAGSPGTGKTTVAAAIVRAIRERVGGEIGLCAPTGKAAVRLTESLRARGCDLRAKTIHSLLGFGSGEEFGHNEKNPLRLDWLIADEMSMAGSSLLASLLAACGPDTHVLLIGDPGQLPPVERGAPLRDLIAADIPRGELTEIRRNGGSIVRVCADIKAGRPWRCDEGLDLAAGKNLLLHPAGMPEGQLVGLLTEIQFARDAGYDPVWDVQTLVPCNAKSPLSRKIVNSRLQAELNPRGRTAGGNPFRQADKIVCTKNGYYPPIDEADLPALAAMGHPIREGKVYVANGELAAVLAAEPNRTLAEVADPVRRIVIPRGKKQENDDEGDEESTGTGCKWELGYALSCHKSQGSEWPVVLTLLDEYPGALRLCSREWIYTAISRAKAYGVLVGKPETATGYCRRAVLGQRRTLLKELTVRAIEEGAA